jgi:hypothetical protein
MYCRFCGKEVKEKSIVCTGCGRPVDTPGSISETEVSGWTWGLLLVLIFASIFFPPIGLVAGFRGTQNAGNKVKATVLLTVAIIMALLWTALILGL